MRGAPFRSSRATIQIAQIADQYERLKEIQKRKDTIIKSISDQDKLTPELEKRIKSVWNLTELEDIYLPFKPKRHTRAEIARQKGLEPLATIILLQREQHPEQAAARFVTDDVSSVSDAIDGAKDIIAEQISENEQARNTIRAEYRRNAVITSKVVKKRADDEDALKFQSYFDFSKPLKRVSSHQLLAMRRGESAGVLRIKISSDDEECVYRLKRQFVRGHGPCQKIVGEATEDAFKRLIAPSIENEFAVSSKEVADEEATPSASALTPIGSEAHHGHRPRLCQRMQDSVSRRSGQPHPPRDYLPPSAQALLCPGHDIPHAHGSRLQD